MDKKELKDLSRKELIDMVSDMIDAEGEVKDESLPSATETKAEKQRIARKENTRRTVFTTIGILIVVAAIAVLLSTFIFSVIQVSGDSMEPTLSDGDVLVLINSHDYSSGDLCCISWQNKLLIKRVIGLPGDSVSIDEQGNVYVNDVLLDEPYIDSKSLGNCDITFPYQVPEGKLFVLGDKRSSSIDSRSSMVGCVDNDQITGKYLFKIWSGKKGGNS